jgi:hypothetical protein
LQTFEFANSLLHLMRAGSYEEFRKQNILLLPDYGYAAERTPPRTPVCLCWFECGFLVLVRIVISVRVLVLVLVWVCGHPCHPLLAPSCH